MLQWPVADRAGATLEIDGQIRDTGADSAGVDTEQVTVDVQPGPHTVRIVRPGFEDFRTEWSDVRVEERIAIKGVRSAPTRHSPSELQTLREEFKNKYEQSDDYQKWVSETDATKKGELLRFLLTKLESEAEQLPARSAQQWAACEQTLHWAMTGQEFVQAHKLLNGTLGMALFSDSERQTWEDQIWDAALKSTRADTLADYLKLCKSAGRVPTEQEQTAIVQRLVDAVGVGTDYADVVARVQELQDQAVLARDVAVQACVEVYVRAAEDKGLNFVQALDLCERMLAAVPLVFESGLSDAPKQVEALADAASLIRGKWFKNLGGDNEAKQRMSNVTEGIKQVRDWASQFARVQTARKAIADGQGTAAEHKLVAFWLLQLGQYLEALPHLRDTDDEALAHIAGPLPEAAKDLMLLADEVERDTQKRKYSHRQEDALHAYARYLRQTALDMNDSTLQSAERTELQSQLGVAPKAEITNSIAMRLILIPAGRFTMGSLTDEPAGDRYGDERPQHEVRITQSFYLSQCEVTQAQYGHVMGDRSWSGRAGAREGPTYPACPVSWYDACDILRTPGPTRGPDVPVADRSRVGVCMPLRQHNAALGGVTK